MFTEYLNLVNIIIIYWSENINPSLVVRFEEAVSPHIGVGGSAELWHPSHRLIQESFQYNFLWENGNSLT